MDKKTDEALVEFLTPDDLRPLRLEAFDAIVATGKPLRCPLPDALSLISWLARHYQEPGEAAHLATSMLTR